MPKSGAIIGSICSWSVCAVRRHSFPGSLWSPNATESSVAVLPEFQRQGIGSALIREAHRRAADSGYRSAVVLGHKDYYPRFGYRKAADFGIAFPFGLPQECCMAVELLPGGLEGVSGTVRYPRPFME